MIGKKEMCALCKKDCTVKAAYGQIAVLRAHRCPHGKRCGKQSCGNCCATMMTSERIAAVIEEESMAVVDRITQEDRRTIPADRRAEMVSLIRDIAKNAAPSLVNCTDAMIREALNRVIRKSVADLRPS